MIKPRLTLLFFGLLLSISTFCQKGDDLFDPSYVHEVRLYFFEDNFFENMDSLWDVHHEASGINVPYTRAFVQIDGNWLDTVGIRIKGLSSYYKANSQKKPFKIDFNEFTEDQEYDGMKKINLHNGACDPGMLRDFLAYDVLRTAGVAAPRVAPCRLYFNDEFWGVYNIIEQIDKTFLKNNFSSGGGTLIKNTGWDELHWKGPEIDPYLEDYEMKTNEDEDDWSDFINFVDVINNTSDAAFPDAIEEVFDVDLFLHVMAVDVMTNNWDSYIDGERNWFLYHEPNSGKMHWIPWDYNLSLGGALTVEGSPYPPFEEDCYIQSTFSQYSEGNTFFFTDETVPYADEVLWEFGDGTTSTGSSPSHVFTGSGKVEVCLTSRRTENGNICENKRCKEINLGFMPEECSTILNGSCPYPATDPYFQLVVQQDDYCCEGQWDAVCTLQYYELSNSNGSSNVGTQGVEYNRNYPLIIEDTNKVLIRRLMNVPKFKKRYLDICCYMLENNFKEERLFPMIDTQADLIRPHILEDPNYIFATDFFEYDVGNGSGGGGDAEIPALKWMLERRFEQLAENMEDQNHNCNSSSANYGWHDIVINEFAASNVDPGGIPDPAGGFGDWIELYNNTPLEISLNNYYLTDDPEQPLRWAFPLGTTILPNDYLIVWADEDEDQEGIHTNFKLKKSGEFIMLRHEDGTVLDSLSYGEQETNLTSSRVPNGTGYFLIQEATHGSHNGFYNSVEAELLADLEVYPNPASNRLIIDFGENILKTEISSVSLLNPLGRNTSIEQVENHGQIILNTSPLSDGCYFLKIEFNDGNHHMQKVIVGH